MNIEETVFQQTTIFPPYPQIMQPSDRHQCHPSIPRNGPCVENDFDIIAAAAEKKIKGHLGSDGSLPDFLSISQLKDYNYPSAARAATVCGDPIRTGKAQRITETQRLPKQADQHTHGGEISSQTRQNRFQVFPGCWRPVLLVWVAKRFRKNISRPTKRDDGRCRLSLFGVIVVST